MSEEQSGFRRGRGVDDALQVTRRILEEASRLEKDDQIVMTFFDIEKAYPRVRRPALWKLLRKRGCPEGFLRLCQALHEHTAYRVRFHRGEPE